MPVDLAGFWISDDEYVRELNGRICISKANTYDPDIEEREILPKASGRKNYAPIPSPDQSKMAFLSYTNVGNPELFVTSCIIVHPSVQNL